MGQVNTPFLVGAGKVDITPPLNVGILMSSMERAWAPFESVRTPLFARAVTIAHDDRRVALISLELLGLSELSVGGYAGFKERIAAATEHAISADNIVLTSTHTHSAPSSLGLTDLYRTPQFRAWFDALVQAIAAALRQAVAAETPCRLATGQVEVDGLATYRRIRTVDGVVLNNVPPPPEKVISSAGPVDKSVRVAALLDARDRPVALLVNAACHPVYEMCIPRVSGDYPGEMSRSLESSHPGATALFLNGAAGNINPPSVSSGAGEAIRHGERLAAAVDGLLGNLRPVAGDALRLARRRLQLPARTVAGDPSPEPLPAEIAALRLGDAAFLFLPGEPFVETGLALYEASPFHDTFIVGYAEDWIGYIPTDQALDEGGYETGPGAWSRVGYGGEGMVRQAGIDLLTLKDARAALANT